MKRILEKEGLALIEWLDSSQIQANPDKIQAIAFGVKPFDQVKQFTIAGIDISCEQNVKLFGVELDVLLNSYINQIKAMSMKAARQLNVLQRLTKDLFLKVRNIDSLPTLISTNVERRFHLH